MKLIKKLLLPTLLISLVISNGLSLFNASFHNGLYAALARLVPLHWQKNSPSRKLALKNKALKKLKTKTKTITQRVSKRTVRNISANIAALPAEAIPAIGTAVILSITAMDLHDACSDLKDMDELAALIDTKSSSEDTDKICGITLAGE